MNLHRLMWCVKPVKSCVKFAMLSSCNIHSTFRVSIKSIDVARSVVCVCLCVGDTERWTDRDAVLGALTHNMGPRNHVLNGGRDSSREWAILEVVPPIEQHWSLHRRQSLWGIKARASSEFRARRHARERASPACLPSNAVRPSLWLKLLY